MLVEHKWRICSRALFCIKFLLDFSCRPTAWLPDLVHWRPNFLAWKSWRPQNSGLLKTLIPCTPYLRQVHEQGSRTDSGLCRHSAEWACIHPWTVVHCITVMWRPIEHQILHGGCCSHNKHRVLRSAVSVLDMHCVPSWCIYWTSLTYSFR